MLSASAHQARVHWGKCLGPRSVPLVGCRWAPEVRGWGSTPVLRFGAWPRGRVCFAAEPLRSLGGRVPAPSSPTSLLGPYSAHSLPAGHATVPEAPAGTGGLRWCPRD